MFNFKEEENLSLIHIQMCIRDRVKQKMRSRRETESEEGEESVQVDPKLQLSLIHIQMCIRDRGLVKLEAELEELRTVKRLENEERLKEAISHGDLSENSEYCLLYTSRCV